MTISESLHCRITDVDRVYDWFIPVRVLVSYGGEDFVQVVDIGVTHVRSKNKSVWSSLVRYLGYMMYVILYL